MQIGCWGGKISALLRGSFIIATLPEEAAS